MVGVGDGEDDIALVGAGFDLLADAVHSQCQKLSLRSHQHSPGADDELIAGEGLLHQPGGLIGHDGIAGLFQNFGCIRCVHIRCYLLTTNCMTTVLILANMTGAGKQHSVLFAQQTRRIIRKIVLSIRKKHHKYNRPGAFWKAPGRFRLPKSSGCDVCKQEPRRVPSSGDDGRK